MKINFFTTLFLLPLGIFAQKTPKPVGFIGQQHELSYNLLAAPTGLHEIRYKFTVSKVTSFMAGVSYENSDLHIYEEDYVNGNIIHTNIGNQNTSGARFLLGVLWGGYFNNGMPAPQGYYGGLTYERIHGQIGITYNPGLDELYSHRANEFALIFGKNLAVHKRITIDMGFKIAARVGKLFPQNDVNPYPMLIHPVGLLLKENIYPSRHDLYNTGPQKYKFYRYLTPVPGFFIRAGFMF